MNQSIGYAMELVDYASGISPTKSYSYKVGKNEKKAGKESEDVILLTSSSSSSSSSSPPADSEQNSKPESKPVVIHTIHVGKMESSSASGLISTTWVYTADKITESFLHTATFQFFLDKEFGESAILDGYLEHRQDRKLWEQFTTLVRHSYPCSYRKDEQPTPSKHFYYECIAKPATDPSSDLLGRQFIQMVKLFLTINDDDILDTMSSSESKSEYVMLGDFMALLPLMEQTLYNGRRRDGHHHDVFPHHYYKGLDEFTRHIQTLWAQKMASVALENGSNDIDASKIDAINRINSTGFVNWAKKTFGDYYHLASSRFLLTMDDGTAEDYAYSHNIYQLLVRLLLHMTFLSKKDHIRDAKTSGVDSCSTVPNCGSTECGSTECGAYDSHHGVGSGNTADYTLCSHYRHALRQTDCKFHVKVDKKIDGCSHHGSNHGMLEINEHAECVGAISLLMQYMMTC